MRLLDPHPRIWAIILGIIGNISCLHAQYLTNQGDLFIQPGAQLYIQGDLLNASNGEIAINGQMSVTGNVTNNSTTNLATGNGEVVLNGGSLQIIGGSQASRFDDLTLDNAAGLQLDQSIQVDGSLTMTTGSIDLNGQSIQLGLTGSIAGEPITNRIFGTTGTITATRSLNFPMGENVAGMGVRITSAANLGSTTIERGHSTNQVGSGNSIERYFDISPANNSGLGATLRIDYFDAELNGQDPDLLNQWVLFAGAADWTPGNVPSKGNPNFVVGGPYDSMGLWTLSADGTSSLGAALPTLVPRYFPNPIPSGHTLSVSGLRPGQYQLTLYDVQGRKAWQHFTSRQQAGQVEFTLPVLAPGMYTMRITSERFAPNSTLIQIK